MSRSESGLRQALARIPALREEFWSSVSVPGDGDEMNSALERAGRVADFLDLGELMCHDALARTESCGCHFRVESQTTENEPQRDDAHFSHVSVWGYAGDRQPPALHKEPLAFENVQPSVRSYK